VHISWKLGSRWRHVVRHGLSPSQRVHLLRRHSEVIGPYEARTEPPDKCAQHGRDHKPTRRPQRDLPGPAMQHGGEDASEHARDHREDDAGPRPPHTFVPFIPLGPDWEEWQLALLGIETHKRPDDLLHTQDLVFRVPRIELAALNKPWIALPA